MIQKILHKCSRILIVDATHHSITGEEWYEYLAYDTAFGLVHRHLRKGRECTWGYRKMLSELEDVGYKTRIIVSDGGTGIYSALRCFSLTERHQRCHVHILRDVRTGLRIPKRGMRKNLRKYYLYRYAKLVLDARTEKQRQQRWKQFERAVLIMWCPQGDGEKNVIRSFIRVQYTAFTFLRYKDIYDIPTTTNQLEGYISHLNTRIKTMRGFKNSTNAELLLNAIHFYRRSS